jgi:hypothetical protein
VEWDSGWYPLPLSETSYRVRYHCRGMDEAHNAVGDTGKPAVDGYSHHPVHAGPGFFLLRQVPGAYESADRRMRHRTPHRPVRTRYAAPTGSAHRGCGVRPIAVASLAR